MRIGSGESSAIRNIIVHFVHLIYSGSLNLEASGYGWHVVSMEEGKSALRI
jgi:hypothetical protein